jgi:bifunctional non-homologous end joining protein LigD
MPATPPASSSFYSIFCTSTATISCRGRSSIARRGLPRGSRMQRHPCSTAIIRSDAAGKQACAMSLEGIVSKRADAPYTPGNRGLWRKVKCLHREEFVVVGWTDPEGRRPYLGALLLAYYDPDGRLVYAGRAGTGINQSELERLWRRLQPLATDKMPLEVPPPRSSRFGSPLVLSRVHWVRPELVAEVKFLTWTEDNLLRQVVYEGLREDKPATEVRRPVPRRQPGPAG